MLSEKCFDLFYVFSFPAGVYVGTLNLIASIPDPSILNFMKVSGVVVMRLRSSSNTFRPLDSATTMDNLGGHTLGRKVYSGN